MQINLTGFLTDSTPAFMVALWNLLIEAQASPAGIPRSFVEEKKEEMRRAKEGDTRALTERDRRMRLDDIRERERSERSERGGGRGRGRGRRGRGGFGNDDNRTRDNGWSSRGGAVSLASNHSHEHTSHLPHRFSVRDIALLRVLERLPYVAGHLLATALLVPAAPLIVVLVLAVQFMHVQSLRLLAVDHPHREAHLLPRRVATVAVAAVRHHTRRVTKSGIVGAEDATAVVLPRDEGARAHPHAAVLRVEAPTISVADAVQAPVAVEGIAPSQAHGHRRVGEGVREIGMGVGAGAGVGVGMQRMGGARKGHLVGAEAGPGV